jgi:hypothetical protein
LVSRRCPSRELQDLDGWYREHCSARTTTNFVLSDENGNFILPGLVQGQSIMVTAWKATYWPAGATVTPPETGVTITLTLHPDEDNPDYHWITAYADPAEPVAC